MCYFLRDYYSLAIHPNKLIVATGQCAGHDKREGKVSAGEEIKIYLLAIAISLSICQHTHLRF